VSSDVGLYRYIYRPCRLCSDRLYYICGRNKREGRSQTVIPYNNGDCGYHTGIRADTYTDADSDTYSYTYTDADSDTYAYKQFYDSRNNIGNNGVNTA
jgi:hypothetical protein